MMIINNQRFCTQIIFGLALIGYLSSCRNNDHKGNTNSVNASAQNISGYKTIMPHTPGYDLFETHCISCHSLRYIQMQPDFPQKKWESIVDKMVKNFGAPIPDSTAKQIVTYLVDVKGIK